MAEEKLDKKAMKKAAKEQKKKENEEISSIRILGKRGNRSRICSILFEGTSADSD